jgi:6,7-dimethyl-8-ribityllumazine synthase
VSAEESWPVPAVEEEAVEAPAEEPAAEAEPEAPPAPVRAAGELGIPDAVAVLEGSPSGADRHVGVVVARRHGEATNALLESALAALTDAGVADERITVMPVPGPFELPIGAMALAKTRRFGCVVALGCLLPEDGEHVAAEAASGLQLAGLETGVPVAFGVVSAASVEAGKARADQGAAAVRTALEMADLFGQIRAQAKSAG